MSYGFFTPWMMMTALLVGVLLLVVVPRVRLVSPNAARSLAWGTAGLALNGFVGLLTPFMWSLGQLTHLISLAGMIGFWVGTAICVYILSGHKAGQA
jgi:hypothetical protein